MSTAWGFVKRIKKERLYPPRGVLSGDATLGGPATLALVAQAEIEGGAELTGDATIIVGAEPSPYASKVYVVGGSYFEARDGDGEQLWRHQDENILWGDKVALRSYRDTLVTHESGEIVFVNRFTGVPLSPWNLPDGISSFMAFDIGLDGRMWFGGSTSREFGGDWRIEEIIATPSALTRSLNFEKETDRRCVYIRARHGAVYAVMSGGGAFKTTGGGLVRLNPLSDTSDFIFDGGVYSGRFINEQDGDWVNVGSVEVTNSGLYVGSEGWYGAVARFDPMNGDQIWSQTILDKDSYLDVTVREAHDGNIVAASAGWDSSLSPHCQLDIFDFNGVRIATSSTLIPGIGESPLRIAPASDGIYVVRDSIDFWNYTDLWKVAPDLSKILWHQTIDRAGVAHGTMEVLCFEVSTRIDSRLRSQRLDFQD